MFFDRVEQRDGLQLVAAGVVAFFFLHTTIVDGLLHEADGQRRADLLHEPVAVFHGLREIVAGVHVKQREGQLRRIERFACEPGHDDGILAAGKQKRGLLELRSGFAQDVNGLGFEELKMRDGGHDWERKPSGTVERRQGREGVKTLTANAQELAGDGQQCPTRSRP